MYRQYARSKHGKRVNIRISGKRHARIGLVAAQCEGALLAPHTYSGTMKAAMFEDWFEEELLKKLPKGMLSSWTTRRFIKRGFTEPCGKILADLDFSAAIFTGIQSHWTHVERFEAKSCRLRSSLWLRFSGSGCRFNRQLAIKLLDKIIPFAIPLIHMQNLLRVCGMESHRQAVTPMPPPINFVSTRKFCPCKTWSRQRQN